MLDPDKLIEIFDLKRAKPSGMNLMASCPWAAEFHKNNDRHLSFGINLENGSWNCYSCGDMGNKGRSLEGLALKLKVTLTKDFLSAVRSGRVPHFRSIMSGKDKVKQHLKDIYSKNPNYAFEYLGPRGVSLEAIKNARVGRHLQLGNIYFMDINEKKELTGWVERNEIWDGRYGYGKGDRKTLLFGLTKKMDTGYLVEGPVDKLKLDTFGFPAIATCGNMIFEGQADRIIKMCNKLVLVPDRDKPATRWLNDAKKRFKGKIKTWGIEITKFKDVGARKYSKKRWLRDRANYDFLY